MTLNLYHFWSVSTLPCYGLSYRGLYRRHQNPYSVISNHCHNPSPSLSMIVYLPAITFPSMYRLEFKQNHDRRVQNNYWDILVQYSVIPLLRKWGISPFHNPWRNHCFTILLWQVILAITTYTLQESVKELNDPSFIPPKLLPIDCKQTHHREVVSFFTSFFSSSNIDFLPISPTLSHTSIRPLPLTNTHSRSVWRRRTHYWCVQWFIKTNRTLASLSKESIIMLSRSIRLLSSSSRVSILLGLWL